MKKKLFWAVVALPALTVIVLVVVRSMPITYKGLALPTPAQVGPGGVLPPAAWLIVGDKAVLASYGSFCYSTRAVFGGMSCADAPAPWDLPDLAAATLLAETPAVVVIASTAIEEFHATVRPWTEEPVAVPVTALKAESKREVNVTAFTLEPLGEAGDQLLEVSVTYNQGGASYFWRLNPAPVPTLTAADQLAMATADLQQARTTLTTYFSALHAGRYAEVTKYYGGGYEVLSSWQPNLNPNDHMRLFKNACLSGRLMCLEVRAVVQEEVVSPSEFKFVVEFKNEDGSLFVRGPCCGASETAMPSQFQFPYLVVKTWNDRFLVQGLPLISERQEDRP